MHILSPKLRVINHLPKIIKSHIVNQIPIHLIFLITPPRQHLHIHCLCSIICTPQRLCISRIEFCSLRCSSLGFRQKRQRFWRRYYFIGFFVRRQPRGFSFGCYLHLRNWSWLLEGKCWGKTGSLLTWPVILTMPEMLDWFSVGQQLQKFRVTLCSLVNFIHIISKGPSNKLSRATLQNHQYRPHRARCLGIYSMKKEGKKYDMQYGLFWQVIDSLVIDHQRATQISFLCWCVLTHSII